MTRPTTIEKHLSTQQLEQRYNDCEDAEEARKWHLLLLVSRGLSSPNAAEIVCKPASTCRAWLREYNQDGPSSVPDGRSKPRSNRGIEPALTPQQFQELKAAVLSEHPEGSLWNGAEVIRWIKEKTGKEHWPQLGCKYLNKIETSLQVPRPQHQNAKLKQQEDFKKNSSKSLRKK
jgi:transposase